jgi:hypothetical protein
MPMANNDSAATFLIKIKRISVEKGLNLFLMDLKIAAKYLLSLVFSRFGCPESNDKI